MLALKVPSADGGEEEGLNDAGIETFLGDVETHLAREGAQNAIDAARQTGKPVELSFELMEVERTTIPAIAELTDAVKRCREFWDTNTKSSKFFADAGALLSASKVRLLRMRDLNTTGLTGGDSDRTGRWYGLVRSAGVSNKADGAGGSFGIGKYAPFAASGVRTVFYSTRTVEGKVAFQGIARLASHRDAANKITRRTGYIGVISEQTSCCDAARSEGNIPSVFQRTEPGTDIFIVGYVGKDGWQRRMVKSILTNFWPAIHRELITFKVPGKVIERSNLAAVMAEYESDDDFDAHHYYRALTSGTEYSHTLPFLGKVTLFLTTADGLPKRVACTRRPGMVVDWKQFQSRRPFSGYFVCDDDTGNDLLSKMEPPRHDKWDSARGDAATSKKALKALYDWMREKVKSLNPVPTDVALDVEGVSRYLPDDAEESEDPEKEEAGPKEPDMGFTPKTPEEEIKTRPHGPPAPPREVAPHELGPVLVPDPDGVETITVTTPETASGGKPGPKKPGGDQTRPASKAGLKPPLQLRSMRRPDGRYELVVRSPGVN